MNHRRRGYVLLITLGLLVLASTLLVAVARSAVRHAADAALEQRRVQRFWAIESARAATLPFAEQILVTAEQTRGVATPQYPAAVQLGMISLTLTVADEQAKASVNELLQTRSSGEVEDGLRRTLPGATAKTHVRLRPAPLDLTRPPPGVRAEDAPALLPPVSGFGQVFDDASPAVLFPAAGASPLESLTVWGDGGLNILRAGRAAMRTALTPTLSTIQIDRLLKARDTTVAGPSPAAAASPRSVDAVGGLLQRAGITAVNRARLPLTGRSACHSVLIRLNDSRRVWYDLAVLDASDSRRPRRFAVEW